MHHRDIVLTVDRALTGDEDVSHTATLFTSNEAAVGAVLDSIRTFRHRYWAPLLLGVIMLFDSWDSIAIAFAMPTLSSEWHLDPLTIGFLISAGYVGQFAGAVSLGTLSERFGRMPVFIVAVAIMSLLALSCAFAENFAVLLVLRLVQGVTIGGAMPVAIAYINELAPTVSRGRYFGLFQTCAISGFGLASLASPYVVPHFGWRGMLGLGAIPIVLLPLVWLTLPESPRWLVRTGRLDAANKALIKLGGAPATFIGASGARLQSAGHRTQSVANMLTLFSPQYRPRTMTVTILWFLTLFTSFGLTTWLPSIYVRVYHMPVKTALGYSATVSLLLLMLLPFAGFLIDRFGRRAVAMTGMLFTAVPLMVLAVAPPARELLLVGLVMTGQVGILFGAFVLWPYTAETYPTDVRALGLGYGSSIGRASSIVTPIMVGFILSQGAPIGIVFGAFGLCALGALVTWVLRTEETNAKPLDAI